MPDRDGRPPAAADPDPRLAQLAELIDEAHAGGDAAVLCQVTEPPGSPDRPVGQADDEMELRLLPLGDDHPLEVLLGWHAPPDCAVLVVRAPGRSRALDRAGRPRGGDPPAAVAVTLAVDRHGRDATVLRRGDDVLAVPGPVDGLVPDACRRALGAPTPPAPASTAALWSTVWLDRLLAAAAATAGGASTPDWAAAAALHPALGAGPGTGGDADAAPCWPGPCSPSPGQLADLAARHAGRWPWRLLRAQPHRTGLGPQAPSARLAGWMDDGAFARWVLAALPDPADLLRDLRGLLRSELVTVIEDVVAVASAPGADQEAG